jgi:hypothetical protein
MKKFHIKRLYKLADYLYNQVEPKDFFFSTWEHCGAPGCAIGHACVLFRKQGFKMSIGGIPTYQGYLNFAAIDKFFGLEDKDNQMSSIDLFTPCGSKLGVDATPKQVARHIRRFCKKMEKKS